MLSPVRETQPSFGRQLSLASLGALVTISLYQAQLATNVKTMVKRKKSLDTRNISYGVLEKATLKW